MKLIKPCVFIAASLSVASLWSAGLALEYADYLEKLGQRESGGSYTIENQYGYIGKYQFGESALGWCRFYPDDGTQRNDWRGLFSSEAIGMGVRTKGDFLGTPDFQENAILRFNDLQWSAIEQLGLKRYRGQTIRGTSITTSGMLAGAHLLGAGNLKRYLNSGGSIVPRDGNGTKISEYIALFAGYNTPFE